MVQEAGEDVAGGLEGGLHPVDVFSQGETFPALGGLPEAGVLHRLQAFLLSLEVGIEVEQFLQIGRPLGKELQFLRRPVGIQQEVPVGKSGDFFIGFGGGFLLGFQRAVPVEASVLGVDEEKLFVGREGARQDFAGEGTEEVSVHCAEEGAGSHGGAEALVEEKLGRTFIPFDEPGPVAEASPGEGFLELMTEDVAHRFARERAEGDDAVDAVDEFLAEGPVDGLLDFVGLVGGLSILVEAHGGGLGIGGPEIGGENDDGVAGGSERNR